MFEKVENKLKVFAGVNFACSIIVAIFMLFVVLFEISDGADGLGVLLLVLGFGLAVYALLGTCWFIYAFAEILEYTKKTSETLALAFAQNVADEQKKAEEARIAQERQRQKELEKERLEAERRIQEAMEKERERKHRIDTYWNEHKEEKDALCAKKKEAEEKLGKISTLAPEERKAIQNLIQAIDEELTKNR